MIGATMSNVGHTVAGIIVGGAVGAAIATNAPKESSPPRWANWALLTVGVGMGAALFAISHGFRGDTGLLPPLVGAMIGGGAAGIVVSGRDDATASVGLLAR